jgi:hypothetical protein
MVMIRKQIYLDKATDQRLKREAKRRGISQAALIREQLSPSASESTERDEARARLIEWLRDVRESTEEGPGTGWKFNREEQYAEREEKARPDRHQRVDQRRRSTRAD